MLQQGRRGQKDERIQRWMSVTHNKTATDADKLPNDLAQLPAPSVTRWSVETLYTNTSLGRFRHYLSIHVRANAI